MVCWCSRWCLSSFYPLCLKFLGFTDTSKDQKLKGGYLVKPEEKRKRSFRVLLIIDLTNDSCSSNSSSDSESLESLVFSPVKPKIKESPTDLLKQIIPNVNDDDYHDTTARFLPVLARPLLGLNVNQLFTLMLGKIPADFELFYQKSNNNYFKNKIIMLLRFVSFPCFFGFYSGFYQLPLYSALQVA
ncbi:PREDICTED: uncharacterized protein LOC109586901 [Amphimedon queenslandica]|uniref:Uncharacterized protein n=1 Tax=Amphimedon queenslandica TaxID=400682 RepID=A0AAN0JPE0_AMPQE|nr:PREDICTED: uncharacterized protein LOC109586901 [Amphimedon queenslandica]|eukprot:XP_019858691.1 PREDICTED: uncharacterized protein LOC109586901 [Amphimedon queenslandica]